MKIVSHIDESIDQVLKGIRERLDKRRQGVRQGDKMQKFMNKLDFESGRGHQVIVNPRSCVVYDFNTARQMVADLRRCLPGGRLLVYPVSDPLEVTTCGQSEAATARL